MLRQEAHPVWQERVANRDGGARGGGDAVPAVRLLRQRALDVVVAVERREGSKLHPAVAQLLVCVPALYPREYLAPTAPEISSRTKSACVRSDHRDLEQLKLEDALDAEVHPLPLAIVVAKLHGSTSEFSAEHEGGMDGPNAHSIFRTTGRSTARSGTAASRC